MREPGTPFRPEAGDDDSRDGKRGPDRLQGRPRPAGGRRGRDGLRPSRQRDRASRLSGGHGRLRRQDGGGRGFGRRAGRAASRRVHVLAPCRR